MLVIGKDQKYGSVQVEKGTDRTDPDEPVFILRAKDRHALDTIIDYAERLVEDDEVDWMTCYSVGQALGEIREWQEKNGTKVPDVGHDKLGDVDARG